MATIAEVQKLAALARVQLAQGDLAEFTREFDAILSYVGQLEELEVTTDPTDEKPLMRNVTRLDGPAHAGGVYTEAITAQFPDRKGDALKVKQIISHS